MKIAKIRAEDQLMTGGKWVPLDPGDTSPEAPWLLVRSHHSRVASKGNWDGLRKHRHAYQTAAKTGDLVNFEAKDAAEFFELCACLAAWKNFEDDAGLPLLINQENRYLLLRLDPIRIRVLEVSTERDFAASAAHGAGEPPLALTEEEVAVDMEDLKNGSPGSSTTTDPVSLDSDS
jgi:hypothetical protein